jgi:hypothetical protein
MNWNEIVDKVTPLVVKIETPQGHGTGFLCLRSTEAPHLCGIATAYHVVAHAEKWKEPLIINHFPSSTQSLVKAEEMVIFTDPATDSAVIFLPTGPLKLPQNPIPLRPIEQRLPIGAEVGWLGFPAIGFESSLLCFFSGNISAWQSSRRAYLVDGVSINGSSGGPVIYSTQADGVQIVGAVSAYIVNRATGEALPGVSVAQDVSHFHAITSHIKSIDEAKKKQAQEAATAAAAVAAPPPTGPVTPTKAKSQ